MDPAGARVAVTGAAGFIGSAVCSRLAADGAEVVGLDLAGADRACDVTDPAAVTAALEGCDLVVHTAALITDYGTMDEFVRVNVRGTRNVLDAARAAGVRRVVHLSSVAGWGHDFRDDLAEDAEPRATGVPYVDTKATSDALARARGATVVRPGDVYGPGSVPWTRRPLEALRAGRFAIPAPGEGLMTLVYVDDLVECIVRALLLPEAEGGVFVAWDGHAVTTREYFDRLAQMTGRDSVPMVPRPLLLAAVAAEGLVARALRRPPTATKFAIDYVSRTAAYSNARAREVLGWEPAVDFEEGMGRTEAWARAEGLV